MPTARAAIFVRVCTLASGKTATRLAVVEFMAALLNHGITPALPLAASDAEVLGALADSLHGLGSCSYHGNTTSIEVRGACAASPDIRSPDPRPFPPFNSRPCRPRGSPPRASAPRSGRHWWQAALPRSPPPPLPLRPAGP